MNNLKGWGLGFAMYAQDNREKLPLPYHDDPLAPVWYHGATMGDYLGQTGEQYEYPDPWNKRTICNGFAVCPSHENAKSGGYEGDNGIRYSRSYSYNWNLWTAADDVPRGVLNNEHVLQYNHIDRLALLTDGSELYPTWIGGGAAGWAKFIFADFHNLEFSRHNDKANILFADWHVTGAEISDNPDVFITGSYDFIP